jgi:hypothetical protein
MSCRVKFGESQSVNVILAVAAIDPEQGELGSVTLNIILPDACAASDPGKVQVRVRAVPVIKVFGIRSGVEAGRSGSQLSDTNVRF